MTIYLAHASSFDFVRELYAPINNSALMRSHKFIFPHDGEPRDSKEAIRGADLIVAEVSHPSTGEGIELGWADAMNKKMICIYRVGQRISSSLGYLSCPIIEYSSPEDLLAKLEAAIK